MKIILEIEANYQPYDTVTMNKKADAAIRRWILDMLRSEHIPFYIEKDENGSMIEACTRKLKVKVK